MSVVARMYRRGEAYRKVQLTRIRNFVVLRDLSLLNLRYYKNKCNYYIKYTMKYLEHIISLVESCPMLWQEQLTIIQLQKLRLLIERTSFGSVPGTVIPKSNSFLLFSPFMTERRIKGIISFKVIPDLINPILSNDVFGIYKKGYLIIKRSYYY